MNNKVDPKFGNGPANGPKWALPYVEAEQPMKEGWREAFYDELTMQDSSYRYKLEYAVRWFGVRFEK
jgi:hypothetical protein